MAAVYADHPFAAIPTPTYGLKNGGDANTREPDIFDELSSDMVLVHNLIGRWLNSIYLQAPHIQPADEKAFTRYMLGWYTMVHIHHTNEETDFFPAIEKMAGVEGLMQANVEQHHKFEGGLHEFKGYVEDVLAGKQKYDGEKVVAAIDEFGHVLMGHLNDEIKTLQGLRKYGAEKMAGVMDKANEEAEKGMKELGLAGLAPAFAHIDLQFEGGLWAEWPPAPGPIKFLVTSVLWKLNASTVKFGACDRNGKLKPLYALAKAQGKLSEKSRVKY